MKLVLITRKIKVKKRKLKHEVDKIQSFSEAHAIDPVHIAQSTVEKSGCYNTGSLPLRLSITELHELRPDSRYMQEPAGK